MSVWICFLRAQQRRCTLGAPVAALAFGFAAISCNGHPPATTATSSSAAGVAAAAGVGEVAGASGPAASGAQAVGAAAGNSAGGQSGKPAAAMGASGGMLAPAPTAGSSASAADGGGMGGMTAQPTAGAAPAATSFNCDDLSQLNLDVFPNEEEAWATLVKMVDEMGPRHAGSMGDKNWTDYLEQRMKDMGLVEIQRMDTMVTGTNGLSGQGQPTSGTSTHMVGILPGASDQIISIGCHKDGPNSVEENGTVIAIEVMEYLSKVPKECRKHSFAISFPTCHMATCSQADVPAWNRMFPDVVSKTIAWLAPEHAGHKRRPADGGTTIQQAFLCTTAGLNAECESLLADIRKTTGESADQWFISTESLGSSGAWSATTGKPTVGSMSYWDTLAAGLTDTTITTTGIDKRTFHQVMLFYGRLAGWIDGHADKL